MTERQQRLSDDNGSECLFDFYCEFCREDGKMLEAEGYCVDCAEYLCDTCYTHHRRNRSTRNHVLMDKDKMPKDTPLSHDKVNKHISRQCEHHSGKLIEYFCKSHDFLGCSICIIEGHGNCGTNENIEKVSESKMESQEYKDFIEMLKQINQRSHDNIKLVQENLTKSKGCFIEIAKSLRRFREEINAIMDELEKNILTQAENHQKDEENKLKNVSDRCTTSLELMEKILGEFDQLQTSRKVCDMYIRLKESKREAKETQAQLNEAEKENVVNEYIFGPNTELKEFLKSEKGLGKLSVQTSVTAVTMPLFRGNPVSTKATHMAGIVVKSSKDRDTCCITGSVFVANNKLIIVDNNNYKVKLIDTQSNQMIGELTVSNKPWDVTVISRNQAAVTLYDKNIILLLSMSDTLTLDREINVGCHCRGVSYSNNRLVVTYSNPVKLEIMDLYGKVVKKMENNSDGYKLFNRPQYVCVNNEGNTIYVSDCGSNKVISLNFDGVVNCVYSDNELKGPEKVCVDHHGNVFVCAFNSRNVHMLTEDLAKIEIILTQADGLDINMFSVCHCQETNRLYVGMGNNKVKVYQLSQ